jgi:hypothetical protein
MWCLFIFCLVSLAIAQVPLPCSTPPQWEARIYSVNEQQKLIVSGKWSYDSVYRRVRILQDIHSADDESYFDILRLFESKIEFVLNVKTGNCTRQPLLRPWRDIGIQPGAINRGEAYLGSSAFPGAGLLVTIWFVNFRRLIDSSFFFSRSGNETVSQNKTVTFIGTWTYEACLPVSDTSVDPVFGISHTSFYDVSGGISDPNVFIPPRACLTDEEYSMRHSIFAKPIQPSVH